MVAKKNPIFEFEVKRDKRMKDFSALDFYPKKIKSLPYL